MNPTDNTLTQINEAITKGISGVIVLPANPTNDAIASGTALYLGLSKIGKNVAILSASTPETQLAAADKIQNTFTTKGDNLVIAFPYTDGAIDKVDYNIQGDTFNLIITPRAGQPKLDPEKVNYSYTGGSVDFIITVDAPNLNSLGTIYTENQREFQGKTIINIDRHLINNMFGTVNYINKTSSSTSELVLKVLKELQCEIDKDMATNLYSGITGATNFFSSYSVNADTFEAASSLLKMGAVKRPPMRAPGASTFPGLGQPQPMAQQPMNQQPMGIPNQPPMRRPMQQQQPMNQPMQVKPMPQLQPRPVQQAQPVQQPRQQQYQNTINAYDEEGDVPFDRPNDKPVQQNTNNNTNQQQAAPQDWLKPKIFRGGGGLV